MLPVLVAALVVVPLVEIALLIQVGQWLGTLPTLALLVGMSVLGGVLLKREGTRTWRAFRAALGRGSVPASEVADGALVIFGGALLLTPGFATDLVGLACVLPGSRAVVRKALMAVAVRRFGPAGMAGAFAADRLAARRRGAGARSAAHRAGPVVDGSVVDGSVVDGSEDRRRGDEPPRHT
ncbi:MAG TPA: FxsA family protein [Mycobacteriales bacterium]|nr:FxsA family protein [Mycobacteriales bacterium]